MTSKIIYEEEIEDLKLRYVSDESGRDTMEVVFIYEYSRKQDAMGNDIWHKAPCDKMDDIYKLPIHNLSIERLKYLQKKIELFINSKEEFINEKKQTTSIGNI